MQGALADSARKMGLPLTMVDPEHPDEIDMGVSLKDAGLSWDEGLLASFITHPGIGRVLCIGGEIANAVKSQLEDAQYQVGLLSEQMSPSELAQAAATFLPDVIYVALEEPLQSAFDALEALASDARTQGIPLLALVAEDAPASMIEEAYSRTSCDFFRLGHTGVELLARTHLLVRLTRTKGDASAGRRGHAASGPANDPTAGRIDLREPGTGLYSSGYFFHRLPIEVARARRYRRPLTIMAIRCPESRHSETSAMQIARFLREQLRVSDVSTRSETDLFLGLLPEVSVDGVDSLVRRLAADLQRMGLRCGFGYAGLQGHDRGCAPQELIDRARRMADAKFGIEA